MCEATLQSWVEQAARTFKRWKSGIMYFAWGVSSRRFNRHVPGKTLRHDELFFHHKDGSDASRLGRSGAVFPAQENAPPFGEDFVVFPDRL